MPYATEDEARSAAVHASIVRAIKFRHCAVLLVKLASGEFDYHGMSTSGADRWPEVGETKADGATILARYFNGTTF